MFHILGILFIIIIAILIIGLSIVGTVIRSVFGLKKRGSSSGPHPNGNGSYKGGGYSYNGSNNQQSNTSQAEAEEAGNPRRKKLFAKDEGEYVDFEEIKDKD